MGGPTERRAIVARSATLVPAVLSCLVPYVVLGTAWLPAAAR